MTVEDAVEQLRQIAEAMGAASLVERKNGVLHMLFTCTGQPPALIRIFETKKDGLTVDGSMGKNKALSDRIISEFTVLVGDNKVKPAVCVYKTNSEADRRSIYNDVKALPNVTVSAESFQDYNDYTMELLYDERGESVRITQYNTGRLVVQGKTWELWDVICSAIETIMDVPVTDVLIRFVADHSNKVTVEHVITSDVKSNAEATLRARAREVFEFLWPHDRKCLLSAQYLIASALELPEYTAYVAPAAKALEGFLKKCALELGVSEVDVSSNDFFKETFYQSGRLGYRIQGTCPVRSALKKITDEERKARIEKGLIELYEVVVKYRHSNMHSKPPVAVVHIGNYESAVSIVDNIISLMIKCHKLVNG